MKTYRAVCTKIVYFSVKVRANSKTEAAKKIRAGDVPKDGIIVLPLTPGFRLSGGGQNGVEEEFNND